LFTGQQQVENVGMTCISFHESTFYESEHTTTQSLFEAQKDDHINWLNIVGLHEEAVIEQIGTHFNVNKLSLEDILSVGQRPKVDEFDTYVYLVLKMLSYNEKNEQIEEEQVSFLLFSNTVITFQERPGDVFDYIRKRLEAGKGTIRKKGADYLLYALLDAIVDHYFAILEKYGDKLYEIELQLLENPERQILETIHSLRKETVHLRRSIYPLRELVSKLEKSEHPFIQQSTKLFVRDLYDHTIQVIETVEIFRDSALGLSDLYMNSLSNKMNNVMKTLTIIATIFIPLTFVVGVYGMNFDYMPELKYRWAYPAVLVFMTLISLGMIVYFRRKKYF
jgi:magnesium transporter